MSKKNHNSPTINLLCLPLSSSLHPCHVFGVEASTPLPHHPRHCQTIYLEEKVALVASKTVPNQSASDTFRSTCIGWGYFNCHCHCYHIQLSQFSCISFLHLPSLLVLLLHLLPQVGKVHCSVECLSHLEWGHLY